MLPPRLERHSPFDSHTPRLHSLLNDGITRDGETVWVAPGIYQESWLDFKGKAVKLISIQGELETTIDAEGRGPVVRFYSGEAAETVLEGFTLRGGRAGGREPDL